MKIKNVVIFIIIVVIAVVVYNQFISGKGSVSSPAEQELSHLIADFRRARQQFNEANSAGAIGGMDMTAEIDKAIDEVYRIENELASLRARLSSETALKEAERLQDNINRFKRDITR